MHVDRSHSKTAYTRYRAYLLRLWQESPDEPWRMSLQDAITGEQRGFADLERLLVFLKEWISQDK